MLFVMGQYIFHTCVFMKLQLQYGYVFDMYIIKHRVTLQYILFVNIIVTDHGVRYGIQFSHYLTFWGCRIRLLCVIQYNVICITVDK